jgi:transcriptional regulator with XRE-family HTH domain
LIRKKLTQPRLKLKQQRKSLGFTQEEVAEKAGIGRTYYTEIENGNRSCSLNVWLKIGESLNIPESDLIPYMKEGNKKGA